MSDTKKKKKRKFYVTLFDFYNRSELEKVVDKKTYVDINKVFFIFLSKAMIETGYIFRVPYNIGSFYVGKRKSGKKKILDYPHYRRTGEMVFRRMSQTDNFIAFFEWSKRGRSYSFKYKNIFKFLPIRKNKKELTQAIKTKNTMHKYKKHGSA